MIAINNTYNGFNLYSLPYWTPISLSIERDLHQTATSGFLSSDRLLVYPGDTGVLKLWDIPSKSPLPSVSCTGESLHAARLPLALKHNPKITIRRGSLQLR
jgi:hypothetical protein